MSNNNSLWRHFSFKNSTKEPRCPKNLNMAKILGKTQELFAKVLSINKNFDNIFGKNPNISRCLPKEINQPTKK